MSSKRAFVDGFKSWRSLFTIGLVAFSFASVDARADVLLDTFSAGDSALGSSFSLYDDGSGGQSLAVPFSTTSAVTVDSILAAITVTGKVNLGIMADAAGLPSNSFLYKTVLSDPTANVLVSSLGWKLGAGNFWIAAVVADNNVYGSWPGGNAPDTNSTYWAFTMGSGSVSWLKAYIDEAPAVRITTAVPEPESYAMMVAGLGLMGIIARRKKKA